MEEVTKIEVIDNKLAKNGGCGRWRRDDGEIHSSDEGEEERPVQ